MKKRVYYAHSMSLYGTKQEARDIATLEALGFEVVNPSNEKYTEMCKNLKEACEDKIEASKRIMDVFVAIAKTCDAVAFRAFVDGRIGSGVAKEIKAAKEANLPIIELPTLISSRELTIDETREYLRYHGER